MHAMKTRSHATRLLLFCLLAVGMVGLLAGSAQAGEKGPNTGHGSNRHEPRVEALLAVASTDQNDLVDGQSSRNLWRTLRVQSSFSVSAVRDVYVYVYWRHLTGDHHVTLLLHGPDHNVYQQRVMPITVGDKSSSTREVPGVENPVDVQPTRSLGPYEVSTIQLPVAGTWITRHRLLGTWQVDVSLDEASTPIVSGTFALTE